MSVTSPARSGLVSFLAGMSVRSAFLGPVKRIGACAPATRVLAAVLSLLLLPLLPVPTAAQEPEIVVKVGEEPTASVVPGGEISLPVRVDLSDAGGLDLSVLEVEISWNPVRLDFRDASAGTTGTVSTDPSGETEGRLVVAASGLDGVGASFKLLDLSLAAGRIEGPTTVSVRVLRAENGSGGDLSANVGARSLRLCVGSLGLFGDATGDDAVNIIDAQQIARFSVGLGVDNPERARSLGDVTGDGSVNIVDAQQVARFAVGLSAPERAGAPAPGGCPEPAAADDASEFLAAYSEFTGETLAVVPFFTADPGALDPAVGLDLRIDESAGTLVLKFVGADGTVVGEPLVLAPDPDSPAGVHRMIARGVSAFGRDGLTVTARSRDGPEGEQVSIIFAEDLRTSFLTAAVDLDALRARRLRFIEKWEELQADQTLTTLERWACLIQFIVDFHVSAGREELELIIEVSDDLVDLFVPDEDVRALVMGGPSVLRLNEVISDPGDLSGFRGPLQEGEGRFRHFAANAVVSLATDPLQKFGGDWVAGALARVTGGDVFADTPDEKADVETNLLGQEFATELARLTLERVDEETETIDDGFSVKLWILRNIGDPDVANSPRPEILDPADGSTFEEGETIGFVGKAVDPQEGIITESTGASFAWTSSLDGELGTGTSVLRDNLSVGEHVITLEATDSDGNTGSASITITVEGEVAAVPEITDVTGTRSSTATPDQVEFEVTGTFPDDVSSLSGEVDPGEGGEPAPLKDFQQDGDTFTATAEVTFTVPGSFTPHVTVESPGGSDSQDAGTVNVTELTITKDGTGEGTVTGFDDDSFIVTEIFRCGSLCSQAFTSSEELGISPVNVRLEPDAAAGSAFDGWDGDTQGSLACSDFGSCTVPMDVNRTITATFTSLTGDGEDELATGVFTIDPFLGALEGFALFFRQVFSSSDLAFGSRLQVDEKQFGQLSGKLPVGFSGENGYAIVDLLTGESLLDNAFDPTGSPAFGVIGLTETPPGPDSPATIVLFGETGFGFFNTEGGGINRARQATAFDAFPAGGNPESGYAVGIQQGVVFIGFDEANGDHDIREVGSFASAFEGEPISAWMPDGSDPGVIPALVLARDTDPGDDVESGVYVETRNDDPPARAADVGLDARRIRCARNGLGAFVCAVTVFGDDELALLTWDGTSSLPGLVGTTPMGDGPVDLDMRLLESGRIGVVTTGFNDNTVTVTELDTGGNVVSSTTRAVPSSCESPAHAIFVRDGVSLKVVGTCTESANYFVIESGL